MAYCDIKLAMISPKWNNLGNHQFGNPEKEHDTSCYITVEIGIVGFMQPNAYSIRCLDAARCNPLPVH